MNRATLAFGAVFAALALAAQGQAQFPAKGVRLLSQMPLSAFRPASWTGEYLGSAILGYTSPGGREYAIMGASDGKHFIDITDPANPVKIASVPTPNASAWQEMCVLNQYCYGVSEHNRMHIIDLRQIDSGVVRFVGEWTTTITGVDGLTYTYGKSHTAQANPRSNTVFLNGSAGFDRRYFIALNCANPEAPVISGYIRHFDPAIIQSGDVLYVHDCTIVNYDTGPYAGKEIAFLCCGYDGLWIADVTNKASMTLLSHVQYLATGTYCHSGSLSPDRRFYYVNDEFDEGQGQVPTNSTHIFNVENLSAPVYLGVDNHGSNIIDHNSVVQDNRLLVSSYRGGVRIFRWNSSTDLQEVGFFDSHTIGPDAKDYEGNWGVDGNFPSGNIVLSDRQSGLFVLDPSEALGHGAPPISETFTTGFRSAGGFTQSRRSDNTYLVHEGTGRGLNSVITLETTNMPAATMTVNFEGKSLSYSDSVGVWLKDVGTGSFVNVGTFHLSKNDKSFTISGLATATYVSPTNRIEVRFTLGPKSRFAPGNPGVMIDRLAVVVG